MLLKTIKSDFFKSVFTLMTGTLVAQVIAYFIFPILTRIYSPAEMGDLGVYTRMVAFIAAFATARYELTLPITKQDTHAFLLYRLSLKIALIVLVSLLVLGIGLLLFHVIHWNELFFFLLVVLSTYITVWINLGTSWAIRRKLFKQISLQRIVNALSVNGLRLVFGLLHFGSIGLIVGSTIGAGASIIVFVKHYFKEKKDLFYSRNSKRLNVLASEYKAYPLISLPHTLLDLAVELMIASLIIFHFGKEEFGSYSYAYLMLRIPLMFIGQSIGQVFFNRCNELLHQGKSIHVLVKKTIRTLLLIAILPFTLLYFYGEPLFKFIFGSEWGEAGHIAEIVSISLLFNFLVSPISTLALTLRKQKVMFGIGIFVAFFQFFSFGVLPILCQLLIQFGIVKSNLVIIDFVLGFNAVGLILVYCVVLILYFYYSKHFIFNPSKDISSEAQQTIV